MAGLRQLWVNRRVSRWTVVAGICAVVIAAAVYDNDPPPPLAPDLLEQLASVDKLAAHFDKMATNRSWQLVKWTMPVRVAIYGEDIDSWLPIVEAQFTMIASLTHLKIKTIENWGNHERGPNFIIEIVPPEGLFEGGRIHTQISDSALQRTVDSAGCFATVGPVVGADIRGAAAIVSTAFPHDYVGSCMFHEILHGIGLDHSWVIQPSIMNPTSELSGLTINDKIIIRTLYDPRIEPGMSLAEARKLARVIITEIHGRLVAGEKVAGITD